MKILEIKNNLVKISYTAQDNLVISGFVIIEDSKMPYVAQIMSLKADSGINYAIVKLLFTFNEEGVVKNYAGTIPDMDADITFLSANELLDILPIEKPLIAGKLAQRDFVLNIDYSVLEKNLLVCSDNNDNTDLLLSNLAKQITENNNKSIIFDTLGTVPSENKLVFGKDFKLPLNYDTINFIYEHDLGDVDPTSKAIIQDILLEVQEYSKTVLDKFIPFDSFISVVDAQYKILQIPELALLKNRLLKYKEQNAFAQEAKDIHNLKGTIRANLSTTIDISALDANLQKLAISTIYDEIYSMDLYIYSLIKIDSDNADKKLLKTFINQNKIFTTIFTSHEYKYLHELKERASNMIFFAPISVQHDFGTYNVFLNKLNSDEFVITGKATQNIPLILELLPVEELRLQIQKYEEEAVTTELTKNQDNSSNTEEEPLNAFDETTDIYSQDSMIETEIETEQEISDNNQAEQDTAIQSAESYEDEGNNVTTENLDNNDTQNADTISEDLITEEEVGEAPLPEEQPVDEQVSMEDVGFEEAPLPEEQPVAEQVSMEDVGFEEALLEETEIIHEEMSLEEAGFSEVEETEEELSPQRQEALSEDDLDMIDTVNTPLTTDEFYGNELNQEVEADSFQEDLIPDADEFIESEQTESKSFIDNSISDTENYYEEESQEEHSEDNILGEEQPPVVPIYPAEETPVTGTGEIYSPGDRVAHPKHGEGVVEKMVKFGNKVLCAINFANGRRLLDPTISQIQKL